LTHYYLEASAKLTTTRRRIMELVKYTKGTKDLQIVDQGAVKILTLSDGSAVPLVNKVPLWAKFIQPGSVKKSKVLKGKKGMFYFPAYATAEGEGEDAEIPDEDDLFSTELRVLYIGMYGIQRALMPPYESDGDNEPICASGDGIWPLARIEVPRADKCGTWVTREGKPPFIKDICESGKWKGKVKPDCKRTFLHLFFDLDRKCPVMLPLHGTNIGPFRKLEEKAMLLHLKAIPKGLDLGKYFIRIYKGEDKDTYIQMGFNFAMADDIDPSLYQPAVAWYQENLLPVLGEDPEPPKREEGQNVPELTPEEQEALKADQEKAREEFDLG
jgi:hypothetical protein